MLYIYIWVRITRTFFHPASDVHTVEFLDHIHVLVGYLLDLLGDLLALLGEDDPLYSHSLLDPVGELEDSLLLPSRGDLDLFSAGDPSLLAPLL